MLSKIFMYQACTSFEGNAGYVLSSGMTRVRRVYTHHAKKVIRLDQPVLM